MPSQKTNLAKRDARMAQLYFVEGLETTDIAEVLIAEGLLESKTEDSARKTVRTALAKLKLQRREDEGEATDDETAKERHVSRMMYSVRKLVALIENVSMIEKVIGLSKDGAVISVVPEVPVAVKEKAMKDLAAISERLAVVTGVEIGKLEPKQPGAEDEDEVAPSFGFNFSGKTLNTLIGDRIGKSVVN
jgi:hypothetical protein